MSVSAAPGSGWPSRALLVLVLGLTTLVFGLHVWGELLANVTSCWSGARLSFSAAVARGIDVYPSADSGLVTGDMYGPLMAVFYLPALLASTISHKILAGQLLSMAAIGIPVIGACLHVGRRHGRGYGFCFAMALATLTALFCLPGARYSMARIHADAPCLLFALASCWALATERSPGAMRMLLACVLVSAATLSKQQGVVVLMAQVAFLAARDGVRRAAIHGVIAGLLTVGLFFLLCRLLGSQPSAVWLNLWTIPSTQKLELQPWRMAYVFNHLLPPVLALASIYYLTIAGRVQGSLVATLRTLLLAPSSLFLWVALVLTPISALGMLKVGGDVNSLQCHFYFALAAALALLETIETGHWQSSVGIAALCVSSAVLPWASLRNVTAFESLETNTHQRAAEIIRGSKNVYFPWHALSMVEVTGRMHHQADGLHSRDLAQMGVSREVFFQHAPEHPSLIVFPAESSTLMGQWVHLALLKQYYPGYVAAPKVLAQRLRGFRVFVPGAFQPR